MFGPRTTAAAIEAFEGRFTQVGGAQFLVARGGAEAWPVAAIEADALRTRYRRRMMRAKLVRRLAVLWPFVTILFMLATSSLPREVQGPLQQAAGLLAAFGLPLGLLQHRIVSELTLYGIEHPLRRRLATRLPAALTPAPTPLGGFAKRLILVCVSLEAGMLALHLCMGPGALAEHIRIFYRQGSGNESMLAQVTGNLAWGVQFAAMLGILLMLVDRRARRLAAERAKAEAEAAAADAKREDVLRRLAAGHAPGH